MSNIGKRFSRRTIAMFWALLVGIVIASLIYYEQISILYVIATLALVVLLLVVGFADLERVSVDGSNSSAEIGK
ncbi:MAG: hypothetical protein ABJA02_01940 [Acidobacteriota bacterium]